MQTYSLRFFSQSLEARYQEFNMKRYQKVFARNLICYMSALFAVILYSFTRGHWQVGLFSSFFAFVVVPITHLTAKRSSLHFNICCFTFQVALVLSVMMEYFLGLIRSPVEDSDTYIAGQAITFIILSFNLGSRFELKAIVFILNIFTQSAQLIAKNQITVISCFWMGTNFMMLNSIYWHDRVQKEAFLVKYNEQLWQQEIGSCAQLSILSFVSQNGMLKLDLKKCNDISQKEFNIQDIDSLKLFLNNFRLIPKHKFTKHTVYEMKSQQKSKKFVKLHTKIYNYSQQILSKNSLFIGLLNELLYEIQIFTTWNDQSLNIHTIIKRSTATQTQSDIANKLKFERKLFNFYREEFTTSIKTIFGKLKSMGFEQSLQKIHGSVISDLQNALRFTYNIQLFLNPLYKLELTVFLLQPLMDKIITVTENSMPSQLKINIKYFVDHELRLQSCQKTIFQIILNLLSIIVRPAMQSGYIIVTAKQKFDKVGTYINISIATNVQSTKNLIDIQNYQKNIYGENMVRNPQNKRVGLEIVVSEYLVGKIGPNRRIRFIDFSEDRQIISFNIYQGIDDYPE